MDVRNDIDDHRSFDGVNEPHHVYQQDTVRRRYTDDQHRRYEDYRNSRRNQTEESDEYNSDHYSDHQEHKRRHQYEGRYYAMHNTNRTTSSTNTFLVIVVLISLISISISGATYWHLLGKIERLNVLERSLPRLEKELGKSTQRLENEIQNIESEFKDKIRSLRDDIYDRSSEDRTKYLRMCTERTQEQIDYVRSMFITKLNDSIVEVARKTDSILNERHTLYSTKFKNLEDAIGKLKVDLKSSTGLTANQNTKHDIIDAMIGTVFRGVETVARTVLGWFFS